MKRDQFLRALEKECDLTGRRILIKKSQGKGSHYRVYVDDRNTIVKSGELSPLYRQIVRKQLGLK